MKYPTKSPFFRLLVMSLMASNSFGTRTQNDLFIKENPLFLSVFFKGDFKHFWKHNEVKELLKTCKHNRTHLPSREHELPSLNIFKCENESVGHMTILCARVRAHAHTHLQVMLDQHQGIYLCNLTICIRLGKKHC